MRLKEKNAGVSVHKPPASPRFPAFMICRLKLLLFFFVCRIVIPIFICPIIRACRHDFATIFGFEGIAYVLCTTIRGKLASCDGIAIGAVAFSG